MAEEKKVELNAENLDGVAGGGILDVFRKPKRIVIDNENEVLDRKKFERKIDLGSSEDQPKDK